MVIHAIQMGRGIKPLPPTFLITGGSMKKLIIAVGILIVCSLENIGHYFGFCFHGWMAIFFGSLGVFGVGVSLHFNNIVAWLNLKSQGDHQHKCDHESNHGEEIISPDVSTKTNLGRMTK